MQPPRPSAIASSGRSYDDVSLANMTYLERHGRTQETLDDQFTRDQLDAIERDLCARIARVPWDRWDCCAVLVGGVAGVAADFFAQGNSQRLSEWTRDYKIETPQVSIDYQGPGFGGPLHRGLSPGHDLLRVFEAISQIKNGTFRGFREFKDGFGWVESAVNQNGVPFDEFTLLEATIVWIRHMLSDVITPSSLPFPGLSFLMQVPDHDVRKFAIALYKNGLNLRFILTQALAPALVELVIRAYFLGRKYRACGEFVLTEAERNKQTELLLASHGMVVAINVGRVAVECNASGPVALRNLNVPAICAVVRHLVPFVAARMRANDPVEILKRNARGINDTYDALMLRSSRSLKEDAEFREFLSSVPQLRV